jgi:hypothetical protein
VRTPPASPEKCPKCGAASPCTDWVEVDVGPGSLYFDYRYTCPEHGEFCYPSTPWSPDDGEPKAVFRDD